MLSSVGRYFIDHLPALLPVLLGAGLIWGAYSSLTDYLDRPDVHKSYLTHECIKVVNGDGSEGSCAAIPDRYRVVWVY